MQTMTQKGLAGALVTVLAAVLGALGYEFGPADQEILSAGISSVVGVVIGIAEIVRRVRASKAQKQGGYAHPTLLQAMAVGIGLLALAALFSPLAMAADATVSWKAPTERTDGSVLTRADIAQFEVCVKKGEMFTDANDCPQVYILPGTDTQARLIGAVPDDSAVPAYFRARALDQQGNPSAWSNVVDQRAAAALKAPVLE